MNIPEKIQSLMAQSINAVVAILKDEKLRVPETDAIIDMFFSYFLSNSIECIPEHIRQNYLQHRLMQLSQLIHSSLEDLSGFKKTADCEDCKNGTHNKPTLH